MSTPIIREADGLVVNVIDLAEGSNWQPPDGHIIGKAGGRIGDTWDGAQYVSPPEPDAPVPQTVSNFQARALLMGMPGNPGPTLFDDVDEALKTAGGADLAAWEYASEFRRDSPLLKSIAAQCSLTDQQVDDMFRQAAQIEA